MQVRRHDTVEEFRAIAEPLYRRDPIANTIKFTVLQAGELPNDSLLLTVWDNEDMIGAAIQTPPYPLACNALPIDSIDVVTPQRHRAVRRSRQPVSNGIYLRVGSNRSPIQCTRLRRQNLDHAGKCGPRTVKLWRRPRPAPQVV
ncbi:MAG: hypothetical protein ACXWZI_15995 [Mycobacterium sp.]